MAEDSSVHPRSAAFALAESAPPWWIWAFVGFAVFVRVAFAFTRPVTPEALAALPDQLEYVAIADSIRHGEGIRFFDPTFHDTLDAYRMPGYPALIAACGSNLRVVQVVQAMLDGSGVLAVFLIGRRLARPGVGGLAALAVAVHPYLIYFASLILSETLFTALLVWGVWALLSPRLAVRVGGIAVLLLSVYVRPSAAYLGVAAAASAFCDKPAFGRRWQRAVVAASVAAAGLVLILSPWAVRNKLVTGQAIWMTTNDGFTAYDSFNPRADGSSNQAWFREQIIQEERGRSGQMERLLQAGQPAPTTKAGAASNNVIHLSMHAELSRSRRLTAMAWDYAKAHPDRVASLAVAKLSRFWSPVPLSAEFSTRRAYVIVGAAYCIPLFALAAVGVFRGGLGKYATLVLLLPALYFSLVHAFAVGSLRYRVPCDVPLTVLAAAGVLSFRRARYDGRTADSH